MSIPICETINTGTSNYYYQGKPSEKILYLVSNEKQEYKNNLQIKVDKVDKVHKTSCPVCY